MDFHTRILAETAVALGVLMGFFSVIPAIVATIGGILGITWYSILIFDRMAQARAKIAASALHAEAKIAASAVQAEAKIAAQSTVAAAELEAAKLVHAANVATSGD